MGSIANANLTGFICRLCSKIDRDVVHIYSDKGKRMNLLQIIQNYLSISVKAKDRLPKTICHSCVNNMIKQYNFIQSVKKRKKFFEEYSGNKNVPINELLDNRRELAEGSL